MLKKGIQKIIAACMLILLVTAQAVLPANAVTVYESDGIYHEEGYIFIGESHSVIAANAVGGKAREVGNVFHLGDNLDVTYEHRWDSSRGITSNGDPNTFTMKGNLFFVFEGNNPGVDDVTQISQKYIYSDGNGNMGRGVEKIHEIINANPNIAHWNIISFHGAVSASKGSREIANYYVKSYQNWISHEFPEADCYFMSVATMTKYYKATSDKKVFNNTIRAAFPDAFLDFTDFYAERSASGRMIDTIHWDDDTYMDLISEVIRTVEQRHLEAQTVPEAGAEQTIPEAGVPQEAEPVVEFTVTEVQSSLCTNELTVIYAQPSLESSVILPFCEAGIPIQVTGITSNGFFRVCVSPDGTQSYIAGEGLSPMP